MPWKPIKGALRRAREARGWTGPILAARSEVSLRQIRNLESDDPPEWYRIITLDKLTVALHRQKEHLAQYWETTTSGPSLARGGPGYEPAAPGDPELEQDGAAVAGLPPLGTLSARARLERQLGLQDLKLCTRSGTCDLLGLDKFKRVFSRPKAHDCKQFAVQGTIDDYMGISSAQARVLDAEDGMKFRVVREVAPRAPFYTTIFARAEHADALTEAMDSDRDVAVLVRVVHKPPSKNWKGFYWIEADRIGRHFAFLVEEIVVGPARVSGHQPPRAPKKPNAAIRSSSIFVESAPDSPETSAPPSVVAPSTRETKR